MGLPIWTMCPPTYLSTDIANNIWMKELGKDRVINKDLAMKQWFDLYTILSQNGLVYLLPPKKGLQDQVYIANAGAWLPHCKTMIYSNFQAEGRSGEELELQNFLDNKLINNARQNPYKFEGEPECKFIRDNLYCGGYGIRTEKKALDWIEREFDADIIKLKETNPYLYHLDTSIFPLDEDNVLVYTNNFTRSENRELEKNFNVIPVTEVDAYEGITNSIRAKEMILNASSNIRPETFKKNEHLKEICNKFGLVPIFINLSEFEKSGALLSCCVLHLNYQRSKLGLG